MEEIRFPLIDTDETQDHVFATFLAKLKLNFTFFPSAAPYRTVELIPDGLIQLALA